MRRNLYSLFIGLAALLTLGVAIVPAQDKAAAPATPATPAPATPAPATAVKPAEPAAKSDDDKSNLPIETFEDPRKNRPNFAAEKAKRTALINKAVDQLKLEALALDDFKALPTAANTPKFARPHPLIKDFTEDMCLDVLDRMAQNFTGNEYRDTYIRWHLLWALDKATIDDRSEMGKRLVALIKRIPGNIKVEGRREWYYDPQEAYDAWHKVVGNPPDGRVVIGFPPFQRVLAVPESLKYMTGDQKAKYEGDAAAYKQRVEDNKALEEKWKRVIDQAAIAFNARVRNMNYIIRQYRGELLYYLIKCGDPEMAKLVAREIAKQAQAKNPIAFDMLAYLYKASFEGALNLYDQATLNDMSTTLEGAGRAMESLGYVDYGGQKRNFTDYVFHMVKMLKDGGGFIDAKEITTDPLTRKRKPTR
jgi:hypothetical protein